MILYDLNSSHMTVIEYIILILQGIVTDILYRTSVEELCTHSNTEGKVNVVSMRCIRT